jgi:hypothetical protein
MSLGSKDLRACGDKLCQHFGGVEDEIAAIAIFGNGRRSFAMTIDLTVISPAV